MSEALAAVPESSPFPSIPGELTETGLTLPAGLPYEEWERVGEILKRVEKSVRWWIGDWIRYGEREYGEMYSQAIEATGMSYSSLTQSVSVAERIEPFRRRKNVSWSHHAEVAALEPSAQDAWLDKAEEEGWSKAELRAQVKAFRDHPPQRRSHVPDYTVVDRSARAATVPYSTETPVVILNIPCDPAKAAWALSTQFDATFLRMLIAELQKGLSNA